MELKNIEGNIIGIISNKSPEVKDLLEKKVKEIIPTRIEESLKMVHLESKIQERQFKELSSMNKNKVLLAKSLQEKEIILYDFSKGMIKKELDYFKGLFKKLTTYKKKIILYSMDAELFLNCVDTICIMNNDTIVYHTSDIFDPTLYMEIDKPEIVNFLYKSEDLGIKLNNYKDLNELLKAIYRIKS